jgi:hypothetical protein
VASGKFSDAAGNENADGGDANNAVSIGIDTILPTVAISSNRTSLRAGETATLMLTLSETSTDFVAADITVSGGTLSEFAGSGTSYTATFTPAANSTAAGAISVASGKFSDAAGNENADGGDANNAVSIGIDTILPTIALSSDKASLRVGETATITFILSEAGWNFAASDINASGGVISNFSGTGVIFTSSFTADFQGTRSASIAVAGDAFSDEFGNFNEDGNDLDNRIAIAHVNSSYTGSVSIEGLATQGQELIASNTLADADGLATIRYQWKADGANIPGATGASLTLTQAEVGKSITVVASYTDQQGTTESATSQETDNVANVNDQPTGSVTIEGTATQGQTLSVSNTLADADGLGTISYQWKADGENIAGATAVTLPLTQAEVGKSITAVASYKDQLGANESVASLSTDAVANVNDQPTGANKNINTEEDTAYVFSVVDFGFNDLDTGDVLGAVRIDSLPNSSKGLLKLGTALVTVGQVIEAAQIAVLKFEPSANMSGSALATFKFSVRDAQLYDSTPKTVTLDVTPAPWIDTAGHVYHWKSHALIGGVNVSTQSLIFQPPEIALFDLRQLQYKGKETLQAEVWLNTTVSVDSVSLTLSADAGVPISFTPDFQAFSGWTLESNPEVLGDKTHLLVAGFTQSEGERLRGVTKLGSVQFNLSASEAEPTVGFAFGEAGEGKMQPYEVPLPWAQASTTSDGGYALSVPDEGSYRVQATKSLTTLETGSVISAADALAALKLSVGINPNSDPDGTGPLTAPPVSPYQYLAADVNGDGRVSAADALAILKMAVRRSDAPAREWLFVNESHDFWNEAASNGGAFITSRSSVPKEGVMPRTVDIQDGTTLNLVAVLKGDVNGNWTAPQGSSALPDSYFYDLVASSTLRSHITQFGLPVIG